jgi:hypothetical protein
LQVTCDGDPVRVSMCHCLACQRRTGSAFALTARWPGDRVTIAGDYREFAKTGDEGSTATFRFCPTCGTSVYFTNDSMPGMIAVPVGGFAEPTFPPPQISVYGVRRHPWLQTSLAIEELD